MKYRIVHSQDIFDVMRFDSGYHNADVNIYDGVIKTHSSHNLSYYCSDIFTSGRNKRIYTQSEFGYPFLSNSDVVSSNPFMSCKYSSKKYGYDESAVLKSGMIVTGRVGAIGQTAFIPSYIEKAKAMGSDNIIRIVVKPQYQNGYIYAYLASRMGCLSFWKHATGGVQPFITDSMVGMLPIPDLCDELKNKINDLVLESARLREEATDALDKAHKIIEKTFLSDEKISSPKVKISTILKSHNTRFEASYYTSRNRAIYDHITSNCEFSTLSELTEDIFRPGIFKREYVKKGVTFLGGADILLSIPDSEKKLSFRQVDRLPELKVKKGWILVTCGGTIGNCVLIDEQLEKCVVSQHVMRVVPKETTLIGYLYAMLSSKVGHELITMFTAGSVIPQIESHHLGLVPIPILEQSSMEYIDSLIETYTSKNELSKKKECIAISLVEQEIEKWNK